MQKKVAALTLCRLCDPHGRCGGALAGGEVLQRVQRIGSGGEGGARLARTQAWPRQKAGDDGAGGGGASSLRAAVCGEKEACCGLALRFHGRLIAIKERLRALTDWVGRYKA